MSGAPATWMAILGGLSLLPLVAVLLTSFVKLAVVLSIARSAFGAPQVPPNAVVTGLALVLSLVIMAPVASETATRIEETWPALEGGSIGTLVAAASDIGKPLMDFLIRNTREDHVRSFQHLLRAEDGAPGWAVLVPAYVVSQLQEAFRMGFVLFLPFLVLDLLVGSVLLSLGMHMLSPAAVALPFKLLLFVCADGWELLCSGLVGSYR